MPRLIADGDGEANLAEYLAGTNPSDPLNVLRCSVAKVGGQTVIQFVAAPNKSYTVQFKDALSNSLWSKLTDIMPDAATRNLGITDPTAPGHPTRFYRLVTPMQP